MRVNLSIAFLFIYLFAVSGLTFNVHYCGGKLSSVKLALSSSKNTCGCSSKKKDKGCCKDKQVVLKVKESHKIPSTEIALKTFSTKLLVSVLYSFNWNIALPEPSQLKNLYAHAPPDEPSKELFLLNCVFLI